MRHIISLLLENEPGALSRVVGLFSQRNYNIESLTVAPTEDPTLSRLTLTTVGHDEVIEQITKNLNKLIEVVKLVDLSESAHIENLDPQFEGMPILRKRWDGELTTVMSNSFGFGGTNGTVIFSKV